VDKVALGQVFSEYFGFPCQFSFHRLLHTHHHLSSGAGTIGQQVADVPSGLSLTPRRETKKKRCYVISSHTELFIYTIFWDITPRNPLKVNQRFGGTYRFHLQGRKPA
jgi:hypothetical protein